MAVRKLVERTYIDSDWTGLSTDPKPTKNVGLNNLFLELDTGDFYYLESLGSITEETVFDEEVVSNYDYTVTVMPSGEITVVFDNEIYVCEQKSIVMGGEEVPYWGANLTIVDDEPVFDWEEYPFNLFVNGVEILHVSLSDENEHTMTITAFVETQAEWKKVGGGSSPTPPTPTPTKYYAIEPSETGSEVYMGVVHYTALTEHAMKCDITDSGGITVTIDMESVDSNVWEGSDELFEVSINGIVQDVPAYEVWITNKTELVSAVSFSFYSLEPLTAEPSVSDELG